ncbi:UNVERIFIED_CONTAM: hypothetical protein Sradi_3969000 [Sesamum radiatum]|uniref:Uncharacterized protein n=1 Tax=Sesamum radiatum TaxID=300843 RepID=A0AAW2PL41_SESRA
MSNPVALILLLEIRDCSMLNCDSSVFPADYGTYCLQLVACGIAVATYNDGATDFKETPAYKESIQSQELLEEPDTSNSDVFESNPTEQAPSLE